MKRHALYSGLSSLLILSGCSLVTSDKPTGFETHAMKGSFNYIGNELPAYVARTKTTTLKFPFSIRGVSPLKNTGVRASIADKELTLKASPLLSKDGAAMTVYLLDGRAVPFKVFPAQDEVEQVQVITPKFTTNFASPSASAKAKAASDSDTMKARLAPAVNQSSSELDELITQVKSASENREALPGYTRTQGLFGIAAMTTTKVRATFYESYIGKEYSVHVLDVQNLTDTAQAINPKEFKFRDVKKLSFENDTLAAYTLGVTGEKDSTRAYVVVKSTAQNKS